MKHIYKVLGLSFFALVLFASCDNQKSVQEYYVEKQDSNNFIAIDLPASIIDVGDEASEETKATLATIKKLNVLAFKVDDSNKADYDKEYAEIKSILKNDKYNELMRMKHEGINIVINFQGSEEAVDEFILLASDNSQGFALARIRGDKMDPAKIIKMADEIKTMDTDGEAFAELGDLLQGFGVQ